MRPIITQRHKLRLAANDGRGSVVCMDKPTFPREHPKVVGLKAAREAKAKQARLQALERVLEHARRLPW